VREGWGLGEEETGKLESKSLGLDGLGKLAALGLVALRDRLDLWRSLLSEDGGCDREHETIHGHQPQADENQTSRAISRWSLEGTSSSRKA
jgi:hypothetical protein